MTPYSSNKVLGTSKDSLISDIYLMDCIEGMKQYPDKYFDLAIFRFRIKYVSSKLNLVLNRTS